MSEKIAQAMVTLAEDNKDVKTSLRLLIKYEIQSLLERLSALGYDSLLLLTNSSEDSCSHLGTQNADSFLNYLQSKSINLKDTFKTFCSKSTGFGGQNETCQLDENAASGDSQAQNHCLNQSVQQLPLQTQSQSTQNNNQTTSLTQSNQTVPQLPLFNKQPAPLFQQSSNQSVAQIPFFNNHLQLFNLQNQLRALTSPQQQLKPLIPTRFSPYMPVQKLGQQSCSGSATMENTQESKSTLPPAVLERKKRNACRHFISKGYCWQGNSCSFLHTRDPQILDSLGITPPTSDDSNQTPSSSVTESKAPSGEDASENGCKD